MSGDIFKDRRRHDRRRSEHGEPAVACRRRGERRRKQGRYNPAPWWLQINYAEEISPRAATAELRRFMERDSGSEEQPVTDPAPSPQPDIKTHHQH